MDPREDPVERPEPSARNRGRSPVVIGTIVIVFLLIVAIGVATLIGSTQSP
jgi:hypothetical protein